MRKLLNTLAVVAIVATMATACTNDAEEGGAKSGKGFKLNLVVKEATTRTQFYDGDVHWSDGDQMAVCITGKDEQ